MVKKRLFLITVAILLASFMLIISCGNNNGNNNDKKEAEKYFERGNAYYKLGQVDKAIKEYEDAILYNKEHKLAHYNLAVLYKEKGRKADAVTEFEAYLKYATEEDDAVVKKYVLEEIKKLKK